MEFSEDDVEVVDAVGIRSISWLGRGNRIGDAARSSELIALSISFMVAPIDMLTM